MTNSSGPHPGDFKYVSSCVLVFYLFFSVLLGCSVYTKSKAIASPMLAPSKASSGGERSEMTQRSGAKIKVGQKMPFFSAWTLGDGESTPQNLDKIIKAHPADRYVLTLCASWCAPCIEGLKRLSTKEKLFSKHKTHLIILVADERAKAREIYKRFSLNWAQFLVDEFGAHANQMSPNKDAKDGILLPRTFVLNKRGKVLRIIGREGMDFIDLLLGRK
jgi:peroxiredoxin